MVLDDRDDTHGTLKTSKSSTGTAASICISLYRDEGGLCSEEAKAHTSGAWHGVCEAFSASGRHRIGEGKTNDIRAKTGRNGALRGMHGVYGNIMCEYADYLFRSCTLKRLLFLQTAFIS